MTVTIPRPNPKQMEFFRATARYIAYGGARGGGKSWAVRVKALLLAVNYPGIRILILRRTFPELRSNHIEPLRELCKGLAQYREGEKAMRFLTGSVILFGYCNSDRDVLQYQGQEYDIIFLDEATQFTEYQFSTLTASLRGANQFPKRFYLTCNPGGVGHAWVKRLFVDREYKATERAEDYVFIQAKATDNPALVKNDPGYLAELDKLPPGLREAWRDGSWDVYAGQYFTEWDREIHVVEAFTPPEWWRWYVTMDYGLDMLAAYLIAVDGEGNGYVVREVYEGKDLGVTADGQEHKGLTVHEAAERIRELRAGHAVTATLAPPDLWARSRESGRSTADLFADKGIYLTKANNQRVAGWLAVKEWLRVEDGDSGAARAGQVSGPYPRGEDMDRPGGRSPQGPGRGPERRARLRIFPGCVNLLRTLPLLQSDEKNPSDCATEPHEVTHAPDALRYFCASWTMVGQPPEPDPEDEGPVEIDYQVYLTGGESPEDLLRYGG